MPRDLGQRHALVNIPAYSIDFVEGGKSVMNERVIVGRPDTPTPVFSKPMSTIVLKAIVDPARLHQAREAAARPFARGPRSGGQEGRQNRQKLGRQLVESQSLALRNLPAVGRRQCTGQRQVPVPQQVLGLPARHAEQIAVLLLRTHLHATAASGCAILSRRRSSYSIGTRGRAWWTSNGSSLATGPTTTRLR